MMDKLIVLGYNPEEVEEKKMGESADPDSP